MADHAQKLLLASLCCFLLGNVQDHRQDETALLIKQRCCHQRGHATAVLAEIPPLVRRRGSCREHGRHGLPQCLVILWRYEVEPVKGLGEQFVSAVAKDLRVAVIEFIHAPVEIDHDHSEDIGLDQRAQLVFAVLQLLLQAILPGHIAGHNHAPNDLACGIANGCATEIVDDIFSLAGAALEVYGVCA